MDDWRKLAHRSIGELEATGMHLRLDTVAHHVDVEGRRLLVEDATGRGEWIGYDKLVIGTGAVSVRPPIEGLAGADARAPRTASTSSIRWATPSRSCARSTSARRRPR